MHAVAEPHRALFDSLVERIALTPSSREVRILATDGTPLAASVFSPARQDDADADEARATPPVVIINSATGVPRRYYAAFAQYLADRGMLVVTYDYRGIGGSRPESLRGYRARMRYWGERDFAGVLDWVARMVDGARPLVIGHSVGGQIAGLAANNGSIAALLLVGAQSGDMRLWPAASRMRMAALFYGLVPALTAAWGYLPGALFGGEDLPAGVAGEWAAWARRPGYLVGGRSERARARASGFARVEAPLLSYSFSDDPFAPKRAVDALVALYTGASRETRELRPKDLGRRALGHFGFFRALPGDPLWRDAARWLEAQAVNVAAPTAVAS